MPVATIGAIPTIRPAAIRMKLSAQRPISRLKRVLSRSFMTLDTEIPTAETTPKRKNRPMELTCRGMGVEYVRIHAERHDRVETTIALVM